MGSPTMKDMGSVMKNVMARLAIAGIWVDGKQVSEIVKLELSGKLRGYLCPDAYSS